MSKLMKFGIPLLVGVLALGVGAGFVLAQGNDTPVVTPNAVAYQASNSWCPQQC